MLLRYGLERPKAKTVALFSMAAVSNHLKLQVSLAYAIETKYFRDLAYPPKLSWRIPIEQIEFLTNENYLTTSCCDSLQKFPQSKITRHHIGRLYRQHGIRNKKLVKVAANPKKYTEQYKSIYIEEMISNLIQIDKEGYEIFQVDESLFSSQDCRRRAWSLPNQNIEYMHLSRHTGLLGVVAAISTQQMKIYSKYKKGYFNSEDMIKFIRFLKRQNAGRKIALFLDNCSIHKSKKVKEYLAYSNIPFVFNLAYAPRFNGIERLWAQMKIKFRNQLAIFKTKDMKYQLEEVVEEVENSISGSTIHACASSGWKNIFKLQKSEDQSMRSFQNIRLYN